MKDDSLFPAQYILHNCDALKALRASGFTAKEYPNKRARRAAAVLLGRADIQEQLYKIRQGLTMDAMECLHRLSEIARGDVAGDVFSDEGEIDLAKARDSGRLWMVQEYRTSDTKEGQTRSVKFYCALEALKVIAKHHGLLDAIFGRGKVPKDLRELDRMLKEKMSTVRFKGGIES